MSEHPRPSAKKYEGGPPPRRYRFRWWHLHVSIGVIALAIAAVLLIGGGTAYKTLKVGGPHGTATKTLTVPAKTLAQTGVALDTHRNMRDQTPPGLPKVDAAAAAQQDATLAASDKLPTVFPDAAPEQRGCTTRLVVNYSSRNGVAPRAFILHYTVSPNVQGWNDVNAVVGIFDRPAYQASSNYVYDGEGNCAYIVRETDKAWTQAAANPWSISVEIIDTGYEKALLPTLTARMKLAMLVSDACYRWKIPIQLGASANGLLTRPGIMDHAMLGVAGGGHHDISPRAGTGFDNVAGLARVKQVIADVRTWRKAHPLVPPKPKLTASQLRVKQRATARKAVLALRLKGESWTQVQATPQWRLYVSLGGR